MAGPIRIAILADAKLGKAQKEVASFGDKVGKASAVGAVGLAGLGAAAIGAAGAAETVAVANNRVKNILGNMGEGKATDRVLALAEAQEALTGVDDVVIKSAQAKLATFAAVAKSADVAGGAFDRATKASVDLAAAGFGTAETNAVQLGKALQDPVKGLSALSRSGITFTASEKARIKTLTESNKAGQAQELILAAIEKQVGGTAAATATSSAKMAAAVENIAESVGALLLPMLEKVTPVVQRVTNLFAANPGVLLAVAGAIAVVAGGLVVLNGVLTAIAIVQKAAAVAQVALNIAMTANPIGLIIVAIAALVAGLIWFFTQTKVGKKIVAVAWAGIQAAIKAVTDWWKNTAWPTIKVVWASIIAAFQTGKEKVSAFLRGALTVIKTVWKFSPLGMIIGNWSRIVGAFQAGKEKVAGFLRGALEVIKTVWRYSPLGIIVSNWGRIISWIRGVPDRVASALGNLSGKLVSAGISIITGFLSGLQQKYAEVQNFIGGIGQWIADHKGPKAYDLGLLVKNGGWIMTGLRKGLTNELPALKKTLGTVAATVGAADMGALGLSASRAGGRLTVLTASSSSGGGSSVAPAFVISFEATGDPLFDAMLNEFRKRIRVNGGSAEKFLGSAR